MIHKRESAGHLPRPIGAPWNRSSAWSPEVLARLIAATNIAVEGVMERFNSTFDMASFTEEERAAAYRLLCDGVTEGIAKFEESLRPHHVEVEELLKSK
jgi:hypothetical protein